MKAITRRNFLKNSLAASLAVGLPRFAQGSERLSNSSAGSNEAVRIAMVGLGGIATPGGVGGRGRQLIASLQRVPGVRIVALCDVDQAVLDHELKPFQDRGQKVTAYRDIRKLLEDKSVDAVAVATPNHWHALATIWACQAGKDVYVEKPFSHDLWEGRQMVAAAKRYGRMVQVGTQNRSSELLRGAFELIRSGQLGAIRSAHALVYRPRDPLGKVSSPTPVPATVDYDCGPIPEAPLRRQQLHYEWHWFWPTGNGEMGNNGIHVIDICRWALGYHQPPPRTLSVGGRFAFNDGADTPNTQIAFFDYQPAPILCEVRNVRVAQGSDAAGKYRQRNGGIVIDCENGYAAGDANSLSFFDKNGQKTFLTNKSGERIKEFRDASPERLEPAHLSSFLAAVRSRKSSDLAAPAQEGHVSTACCHLANVSHRLGKPLAPEAVRESIRSHPEFADAFERCQEHLRANGVDLSATPATLGLGVTFDPAQEKFVGDFAAEANALCRREYRAPYVVPELA